MTKQVCKFCGCTDRSPCLIPMRYVPTPNVPALLALFGVDEYPAITSACQISEMTTPCHWSTNDVCSAPACIAKAYTEACALVDEILLAEAA